MAQRKRTPKAAEPKKQARKKKPAPAPKRSATRARARKAPKPPKDPFASFSEGGCTPEVRASILASLHAGRTRRGACAQAGITDRTLRRWLIDPRPGFAAFAVQVTKAEDANEFDYLEKIKGAAGEDWRAAAWYLSKRNPDDWGERQKLEHSGPGGGPIEVRSLVINELSKLLSVVQSECSEEQYKRVLRRLTSRASEPGAEEAGVSGDLPADGEAEPSP